MINLRMAGRWAASKHLGSSDPFDASGMGPLAQQFNDELGHGRGLPAGTMAAMTPNHQEGACGGWGRGVSGVQAVQPGR